MLVRDSELIRIRFFNYKGVEYIPNISTVYPRRKRAQAERFGATTDLIDP